jgi:DNA gyrase/topoisomerase IV subunit B
MDPSSRRLKQITVSDAKACDQMLTTLMGTDASRRKDFIIENFASVRSTDLDI